MYTSFLPVEEQIANKRWYVLYYTIRLSVMGVSPVGTTTSSANKNYILYSIRGVEPSHHPQPCFYDNSCKIVAVNTRIFQQYILVRAGFLLSSPNASAVWVVTTITSRLRWWCRRHFQMIERSFQLNRKSNTPHPINISLKPSLTKMSNGRTAPGRHYRRFYDPQLVCQKNKRKIATIKQKIKCKFTTEQLVSRLRSGITLTLI